MSGASILFFGALACGASRAGRGSNHFTEDFGLFQEQIKLVKNQMSRMDL